MTKTRVALAIGAAAYAYLCMAHAEYRRHERRGFKLETELRADELPGELVAGMSAAVWPAIWAWLLVVWCFVLPRRVIVAADTWWRARREVKTTLPDEQVYR